MNYLSELDLENIANRLIENPTREELKKLSDEYNIVADNSDEKVEKPKIDNTVLNNSLMGDVEKNVIIHEPPVLESNNLNQNIISTIPIPSEQNSNNVVSLDIPSYNVPNNNVTVGQNSSSLNISDNLFGQPNNNMMATTDNFNGSGNFNLFDQPSSNSMYQNSPTMFGQIQNEQQ